MTKICSKCKKRKDLEKFYINKPNKGPRGKGRASWCKHCMAVHQDVMRKKSNLKIKYGITIAQHDALLAAQGGKCAVCREEGGKLHVDHDHKTGKVRGLVCRGCNLMLGHAKEKSARLRNGALYLEQWAA